MAQKSKDEKNTYEHYVKPVHVMDNFEEVYKLEHRLIRSYDELYNFYKNEFKPNAFFAWDTETTSLNAEQGVKTGDLVEGKIVGYSFTQDGHIGYYVPVSHPDYSLGYKALKIFYAMICRSKLNLLYNCRFDMRFLEAMTPEKYDYTPEQDEKIYKFDLSGIKYIDVQNTVWLADTNVAMPSLKKSEKHFLGWNPPTFSETIGDESNFGYLPAEQGYRYASLDALATYHLFFKTEKYYTEAGAAAKLDNDLLYPLMRLENTPINVDHDYLQSMRGDVLKHLEDLKKYLFETAGREYNINSGRELVTIFQQLGIDTGKRTKTGIMETNIKAIEGYVASHGDSEYLNKLVEYKKLLKFDNSYLEKMLEMSEAENVAKHPIRFCYFTNKVPTGRLASGTDGKNSYFSKLNFQSLPKPHSHNYHVHKATPEQIANGEDLCGYIFNDDPNGSLGLTEGQDPHLNVRKAFCPIDNDSVVVSVDMKAEELRLVANIYKEQTWIKAFNSGQDVHKSCYSDDTEFLTIDGWKTYDKITADTLIAQYDNGNISYVKAGPVYYGDTGELYRFKTKYNDLLVTGNHRMLYRNSNRGKEQIKLAEDLNYGQFKNAANYDCQDIVDDFVFADCYGTGFNKNKKYADGFKLKPDTMIKFLGFYLGDGHAGIHGGRYKISLSQSCCEAKRDTLQWVKDLNIEMGSFFKEYWHDAPKCKPTSIVQNGSPYYTFERCHKTFCQWILDNCIINGIKRIPKFIYNASLRQRRLFIESFFRADGTYDKRDGRKGLTLYIYHKELLDDFQRLCIMSNYST